ncbi:MAG: hypothetical protein O7C60_01705 [Rickettsia endosymbiont of Ixodes persulcatus]|nr:hypothetical protein [Rickettsia endosymbiont of Ixodes persulcatus]
MNLQPDLFCITEKAFNSAIQNEDTITINRDAYNEIEAIAIDNAIMEYISGMVMIKADNAVIIAQMAVFFYKGSVILFLYLFRLLVL